MFVFGETGLRVINNVTYINSDSLAVFLDERIVEVMIIRDIQFYLHYDYSKVAGKTYFWLLENSLKSTMHKQILEKDQYLLNLAIKKLNGIICLSQAHKVG